MAPPPYLQYIDLLALGYPAYTLTQSTTDNGRTCASSHAILNDTFDDDQDSALADYIELSLQLQFNARSRNGGVIRLRDS